MIPEPDRVRQAPCPASGAPHPGSRRVWRKRYSLRGHPFWVLERDVRRVYDEFLDCVIYLYHSASDAEKGARARSAADAEEGAGAGGSGFLLRVPHEGLPNAAHVLAVTSQGEVPTLAIADPERRARVIAEVELGEVSV